MVYTVNEIVREQMIEQGRSTLHKYEQLLPLAVRGARKLNLDVGGTVKTVILTPTSYNTIIPPEDYYSYAQIGVCMNGIIYNLARNPNMCFPHMRNDCGVLQPENFNPNAGASFAANAWGLDTGWVYWAYTSYNEFGEFTGRLYGYQGIYTDTYNVIPERNEIQLNQHLVVDEIVLQYISNGLDATSVSKITPYAQATIEAYITWQHKLCSRHYNNQDRQMAEMEYIKQRKILRARMNTLTIQEVKRILYKSSVATPK